METNFTLFFIISNFVIFAIISAFIYFYMKRKVQNQLEQNSQLVALNTTLNTSLEQKEHTLKVEQNAKSEIEKQFLIKENNFTNLEKQFQSYKDDRENIQEKFENLATKILEEKSTKFDEQQRKGIKDMLEPLKEKIQTFENKVEKSNMDALARHSALGQQIKSLTQLNEQMSNEAVNLTKALKGDNKIQGNWGEIILENILEKSGLEKDREYFVQKSIYSDENKRQQPDIIINTPDEKVYIVDSKVSLKSYEQFVNAECETSSQANLKAHTFSIKKHIDGLSEKKYHELYKVESPDFVLMFIPIDTAFSSALSYNAELYQYAFDRNIVIVTPATLMATLKTVETMWRNDKQQKYALEIATEAGKMYDKFTTFVIDLQSIGKRINQTQIAYDDSLKKLTTGTGNLVTRAEKLKQLGAKANKQIPKEIMELI